MTNLSDTWSAADIEALGGAFLRSPLARPYAAVASLIFSAKDFYRWVMNPETGVSRSIFTCVETKYTEIAPDHLRLELIVPESFDDCPSFFQVCAGNFAHIPMMVGQPKAEIDVDIRPRHAIYNVKVSTKQSLWSAFRRAISNPFRRAQAAYELKEAVRTLQQRYTEIEENKRVIDEQARQLRAAYTMGLALRRESGLEGTVHTIARMMVEEGKFPYARVEITRDAEGNNVQVASTAGTTTATKEYPLVSRGQTVGQLSVGLPEDDALGERLSLLDFVMPTIATAVDDALAMTSLSDYRTNLEHKVVERTDELNKARDELEKNFAELQAAKLARDRIFANVNHELRTPLSLMLLAAEAMHDREKNLAERSVTDLANIEAGGRRLLRLIDDLLALAAGQEGKLDLSIFRTDVGAILRQVVAMWLPAAEKFELQLVYAGPDAAWIEVDPQAFERMVTNLVSNAIKFTPKGGTITVSLKESDNQVRVNVRDTGIGLSEDFKSRIFGRFEQGRVAVNTTSRGSGIGLSLVKTLAEAHHGGVEVESEEGAGTAFTITLPAKQERVKAREPSESAQLKLMPSDFGLRPAPVGEVTILEALGEAKATALVAEDDPELRRSIAEVLRADYRVLVAPDGVQALELASKHLPDVLVSDIGMPGMDGFELSRKFRELPGNRLAPVILLTAFRTLRDRLTGFESGAVDYITKPFDPEELKARVRSQLAVRDLALRLQQVEKIATLSSLSTGLAHEFRNPANGIVNAIEPIRDMLKDETLKERESIDVMLRVISEGATQIRHLSKQLLSVGRQGELQMRKEAIEPLIRHAFSLITPPKNVVLQDKSEFKGEIHCAGPLITQALANLVTNAVQACGAAGTVTVAAHDRGDWLEIAVSDTGPGVPAPLRERIFDAFFSTKGPGGGTGLGLTTARQIALSHNGTLTVSDATPGATFVMRLPLSETARLENAAR